MILFAIVFLSQIMEPTKKRKPWLSVDETINALAGATENGFTAADLHDLILDQQLGIYGYFTGYAITFKSGSAGNELTVGDEVIDTRREQVRIPIAHDHQRLRSTLCQLDVDMPELRIATLRLPERADDTYVMLHQPEMLPSIECVNGKRFLSEHLTPPMFRREELFLRSEEVYGYLFEEAVEGSIAEHAEHGDDLGSRTKGALLGALKATALALTVPLNKPTPLESLPRIPASRLATTTMQAIARSGWPGPKISPKTLADYLSKSNYPV